ncbi:MAG: COX15/CtaA family protein [Proteobacteria bacterium]|nr:COX15/CtaA family protein [Pseudomonadota bacterium]
MTWFRRAARVGALLAAIVVVVGAWVRLTDAGLGCPDWPGCYGHVHPAQVRESLASATAAYPSRPFDYQKAMHEMVHRYIASALGLVIVGLAVFALLNRRDPRQPRVLPLVALGVVCVQGALGAFTVTLLVQPLIVTLHLLGGLTTMSVLWWLSLAPARRDVKAAERPARRLAVAALAVLGLQIALGGWTSTNYAAVACPDFPTCQGSFWPHTDFKDAFVLWRGLGVDYEGGVLTAPARTAIHYTHRAVAVLAGLLLAALAVTAWRRAQTPAVRIAAGAVGAAVVLQWLIGVNLIWQGFPLALGTAHNAGAVLLLLATLALLRQLWPAGPQIGFSTADGRGRSAQPPRSP